MYRHQYCGRSDHADWRKIVHRIVGQLRVDARVDDVAIRNEQQRITIRRGLGGGGRADRAACAGAIVDHNRLAQNFVELCPSTRRRMSEPPPGGYATMSRIGRAGKDFHCLRNRSQYQHRTGENAD
jgi:hypothetical protein